MLGIASSDHHKPNICCFGDIIQINEDHKYYSK